MGTKLYIENKRDLGTKLAEEVGKGQTLQVAELKLLDFILKV